MDMVQHPVNDGLEELILIGMIISKEFISEIEHAIEPGYFQSPHIKQVSKWVLEYWDEFKEVPGTAIQEIYIAECRLNKIRPADEDLIQELLTRVFDKYEGREFNHQYMIQKALDYIRERSLRLTVEEALWLLDRKGSKEAEDRITEHKKVMKKTSANRNNSWLRDFSKTFNAWFYQDRTPIMSFPGNLGRYMHPLLRGKLIAFLAPPKSGKCLKEGTLIPLPNGDIIPIEQIVKRKIKSILTVNEDFSISPGKVTEWHTNGIKPVFKVSTNLGREVEITSEHPLLTPKGWKPLSQLREGDFVAVPKRIPITRHNVKKVNKTLKSPKIQAILDADISWAKITKIEPSGKFPTYDITVDKTHNFITTDFVIHNSWHLIHCAFTALTQRKNVIFFSLEMSEEEVQERFTTMALAKERTTDSKPVEYTIPVYDCLLNQNGECRRSLCPTPGESILVKDKKPKYTDVPEHIPCTACREFENSDYIPETWMKIESRDPLKHNETFRQIKALKKHFHLNGLRIFTFRIGRATITDIENVLDELESNEAWLPDVICLDYADLLDHDSTYKERRHQLGHIWENLSGMAKARQVLLFTASQGNRGSASKSKLESSDFAEDWSKVAIVDGLIGINSDNSSLTVVERDTSWHRHSLQWLAHRYKKHLKLWESCQVLHQFDIGQPVIDSEIT